MNDKRFFASVALLLAIIISSPCRFSSGIVLMIFFNCMIFIGIAANYLLYRIKFDILVVPLVIYITVFFAVFYKQLLTLFSTVLALSMGFSLYVTAFCAYETAQYFRPFSESFTLTAQTKLKTSLKFSAFALFVFLIREILAASTISLPVPQRLVSSGIFEIKLPRAAIFDSFVFFASIPGAIILTTVIMTIMSAFKKRGKASSE